MAAVPPLPFCIGLDVGYGNLKFAAGSHSEPRELVLPSGAAPIAFLPKRNDGSVDTRDGATVLVKGDEWIGGVDPTEIQNYMPELNENYPRTDRYLALFHTALSKCHVDEVDWLVTGLPVQHHLSPSNRAELEQRLQGTHYVTKERAVTVRNVKVLPQPVGAYVTWSAARAASVRDMRVLVVDVGHYSCDFVVMRGASIRDLASGSNRHAMAVILEEAANRIGAERKAKVSAERLAAALRRNATSITVHGEPVELGPYVAAAGDSVAKVGVQHISNKLDKESDSLDVILVTGGGSDPYVTALKAAFPGIPVQPAGATVTSNSRGFWTFAHQMARRAR